MEAIAACSKARLVEMPPILVLSMQSFMSVIASSRDDAWTMSFAKRESAVVVSAMNEEWSQIRTIVKADLDTSLDPSVDALVGALGPYELLNDS